MAHPSAEILCASRYTPGMGTDGTSRGSTNRHTSWDGHSAPPVQPPGTTIGRYMLLESLGVGGMGTVYRAYDPKLRREIALKVLRCHPEQTERLLAEARAMAQLSHAALVAVYDAGGDDAGVYIAMELVRGTTLAEWCKTPRRWDQVVAMFRSIADGIDAAHAVGIVHRDVKPANVLIDGQQRPRIADFGLAAPDLEHAEEATWVQPSEHMLALVVGTPAYMPPEQHRGAVTTAASDQYAFCVMLHEALYGERPFIRDDAGDWLTVKTRGPPAAPSASDVPRWIWPIVRRGLSPEPSQRWPSMHALERALASDPRRRRRRLALLLSVVAIVGIVLLAESWAGARVARACRTEAEAKGPWSEDASARVGAALIGTAVPYAQRTRDTVVGTFESLSKNWVDAHERWCLGAHGRDALPAAEAVLVGACIVERGRAIEARIEQLVRDAPHVIEWAVGLVTDLEDPKSCHDVSRLRLKPPLMAEIADTPGRAAIGEDLQAAERVLRLRRLDEATTILDRVDLALQANPWPHAEITARILRGRVAALAGDFDASTTAFRAATEFALAIGCDRCAIDTGLRPVTALAQTEADAAAVPEWTTIIRGLITRSGLRGELVESDLYGAAGIAHVSRSEFGEARDSFLSAVDVARKSVGPDHPATIAAEGNLAIALGSLGEHDAALRAAERALSSSTALYGDDHPGLAPLWQAIGRAQRGRGEARKAVASMKRALEIEERNRPERHPARIIALNNLAGAYAEAAEFRGALDCAERAMAASVDAPAAERLLDLTNVGWYRYRLGELDAARAVLEQGLALARKHPEAVRGGRSIRSNLGRVYLEQGRAADAIPLLERALALSRDAWGDQDRRLADDYEALASAELEIGNTDRARAALDRATATVGADDSTIRQRIEATRASIQAQHAEPPEYEAASSATP